jgi:predicted 3-demethylubiquinone-9 3-methyltransferase (glyoxalase superfamily)
MATNAKNTICLWYDRDAEQAANFYAKTFPDSRVVAVHRAPADYPSGKKGDVLTVDFVLHGDSLHRPERRVNVQADRGLLVPGRDRDQAETDRYWNAIVGNGGQESMCGWCKDKWGLSWQITPIVLSKAIMDPDPGVAKRAFEAMMTMGRSMSPTIEAAMKG